MSPRDLPWLFWDVDPDQLDLVRDADFILPRVLEFGGMPEVRWVIAVYGLDRIHAFLRDTGNPELGERTLAFWRAVFDAEDEEWTHPPDWRTSSSAPWIG